MREQSSNLFFAKHFFKFHSNGKGSSYQIYENIHKILHISDCCKGCSQFETKSLNREIKVTGTYKYYQISRCASVPYYSKCKDKFNIVSNKI